jgi:hypothetical protein
VKLYDTSEITIKVKKLLALAERAVTEAEAVAAVGMAQQLIANYHLTLSSVELEEEGAIEKESSASTRIRPHAVIIARTACLLFDCGFYFRGIEQSGSAWRNTIKRSFCFVGLAANVEGCLMTFTYFLAAVESLLNGSKEREWTQSDHRAYRIGCAKRLQTMATEIKRQRIEAGGEQAQAVVLIGQQVAKRHIQALNLKGGLSWSASPGRSVVAFDKGYQDAARIDIHGARTSRMLAAANGTWRTQR